MSRSVTRGVLIHENHITMIKCLPEKTMDAVLGAAFRICMGQKASLAVKDCNGILSALTQSIAEDAMKFDELSAAKRKNETERKRVQRKGKVLGNMSHGTERDKTDNLGQVGTERDKTDVPKCTAGPSMNRIERNRIEDTPISPEGICGDSSGEVDFDAMMSVNGVGAGAGQPESEGEDQDTETEDCEIGETALEAVNETAVKMAAIHPNRRGTDSFPRSLIRYLKKNPGASLADIAAGHRAWLESGVWDEEGGRYAPQLARWLWGGDWKQPPPEKKAARPDPRVEDASVFHAGACL